MLRYKIDVLTALKENGYTTYKIRKEHLLSEYTLTSLRKKEPISLDSLDKICTMLNCDVEDILCHEKNKKEKKK